MSRNLRGCWHYDYRQFCTQCDPASYGACHEACQYVHEHCRCGSEGGCEVHPDEDGDE